MPQMMPINWIILFIFFIFTFFLFNIMNYFILNYFKKINFNFKKKKINKIFWKW